MTLLLFEVAIFFYNRIVFLLKFFQLRMNVAFGSVSTTQLTTVLLIFLMKFVLIPIQCFDAIEIFLRFSHIIVHLTGGEGQLLSQQSNLFLHNSFVIGALFLKALVLFGNITTFIIELLHFFGNLGMHYFDLLFSFSYKTI